MTHENNGVFDEVRTYPDPAAQRQFDSLVGLDQAKMRLRKEARLLLDPAALEDWARRHHRAGVRITCLFANRVPLFLMAGDIGTGKTALAESFGDAVARDIGIDVTLFALSLTARGTGAVGQMTTLLSSAFAEVRRTAELAATNGHPGAATILLVDEADALAQSRESSQMHHEDRAGVNALIRGIDDLATRRLPALVVMCTNRLDAIDPAVRRRAAVIFRFERPDAAQRRKVLTDALVELGFAPQHLESLVQATGPSERCTYGYTYSDFTQRFFPSLVLDAFPDHAVTPERAIELAGSCAPTPPFVGEVTRQR